MRRERRGEEEEGRRKERRGEGRGGEKRGEKVRKGWREREMKKEQQIPEIQEFLD